MSYRQKYYQIPDTPVGRSFRRIINNDELIQGRKDLLATIKNTARQWFPMQNILDNPFVLPEGRVRYIAEMISRPWGMKGPDRMWCEGITIPLRASSQSLYSEMELCIAAGNGQMSYTKPTVGLRGKHKRTGHWGPIDWIPNSDALHYLFRRELRAAVDARQITGIVEWPTIISEPVLAKPIAKAIGEPLLEAMANAVHNAESSTSTDHLALITNLRKVK